MALKQRHHSAITREIIADVRRAWELSQGSLRNADAIYVAAAERHATALLTADARIGRSRAPIGCEIVTVGDG